MSVARRALRNWRLKSLALAIAALLWVTMRLSDNRIDRLDLDRVEVRVESVDGDWRLRQAPSPPAVEMSLSGPMGELLRAGLANPAVVIRLDSVASEDTVLALSPDWVTGVDRSSVTVEDFTPSTVRLRFGRVGEEEIPVSMRSTGTLPDSLALLAEPRVDVLFVRARGPVDRLAAMETVFVEPFDLGRVSGSGSYSVRMDTVGLGLSVRPTEARVVVAAAPRRSRTLSGRPVAAPELGDAVVLEPMAVDLVLSGADALLDVAAASAAVRVGIALDASRVLEALADSAEVRVGLAVVGLPRWVEGAPVPDSATARRAGP